MHAMLSITVQVLEDNAMLREKLRGKATPTKELFQLETGDGQCTSTAFLLVYRSLQIYVVQQMRTCLIRSSKQNKKRTAVILATAICCIAKL